MKFNRISIFFKNKVDPIVIIANYNEKGFTNNDLANEFVNNFNSTDKRVQDAKFIVFSFDNHNFIFNKDEILGIQIDVIENEINESAVEF